MQTLVSVSIITYNSASTILDALNSVKAQTWPTIEIIISDDFSTDNTLELCKNWLNENKNLFVNTILLSSEKNTGVPANVNRALQKCKGSWISFLAGDDALKSNCIEDNMLWIASHADIKVLFSYIENYKNTFEPHNLIKTSHGNPYDPKSIMATDRSAESQYKMLLLADRIHYTPSVFLHRETLIKIGGFDERFRLLEDYPLWLNLTRNGYKLHFMDKVTVNYRQHSKAINNTGIKYLVNPNYFKHEEIRKVYTYPYLPTDIRLNQRFIWYASQLFRLNWLNRNKAPNRFLMDLLTIYLNPFRYFIWLKKRLNKSLKENEFYM